MSEPTETIEEAKKATRIPTSPARPARPVVVRPTPAHSIGDLDDEPGFVRRNLPALIIATMFVGGGAWLYFSPPHKSEPARKAPESRVVMVQLPPPPPPPPPPKIKPPEPPKDQKRPEQPPEAKPESKPEPPKPAAKPPEGLGTGIKGPGNGFAGLGSSGNGVIGGTGTGPGGGGSGVGREYATRLSARIADALRASPRMRGASVRVEVRVWVNSSGRVTRAQLAGTTGDAALDAALANEIIPGTQLPDGPPRGLGMPITLRINASRQR
jgi:TonB family protein